MQHISLTPFGRQSVTSAQITARRIADTAPALPRIDKWALYNDLRSARSSFGLTDRSLSVLYALMTFLPARELAGDAPLVVFPSNASLSDRAHGMPESTLRRHLAALVQAGVIWRRDSPNGKRFSRSAGAGQGVTAFGFDLRPLLLRAPEITEAAAALAEAARATREARETLVLRLRDAAKLLAHGQETGLPGDWPRLSARLAALHAGLRRKMTAEDLSAPLVEAGDILRALVAMHDLPDPELIGSAAHSGRHQQSSMIDSTESEPCQDRSETAAASVSTNPGPEPALPLTVVCKACPDIEPYARSGLRSWRDLVGAASHVRGMMGISAHTWEQARQTMGPETAAMAVAAILQRFDRIANPGGYLRALTAKAASGGFSAGPMIMALLRTPIPPPA